MQDVHSVFGADLFCHKKCIKSHLQKYDRHINKEKNCPSVSKKVKVFQNIVSEVDAALERGGRLPFK